MDRKTIREQCDNFCKKGKKCLLRKHKGEATDCDGGWQNKLQSRQSWNCKLKGEFKLSFGPQEGYLDMCTGPKPYD